VYGEIRTLRTALAVARAERLVAPAASSFSQEEVISSFFFLALLIN
jgi:hypothetical protein